MSTMEDQYFVNGDGLVEPGTLLNNAEFVPMARWICKVIMPHNALPQGDEDGRRSHDGFCMLCGTIAAWMITDCQWIDMTRRANAEDQLTLCPDQLTQDKLKRLARYACRRKIFWCTAKENEKIGQYGACDECVRMAAIFLAFCPWIDSTLPWDEHDERKAA